MNRHKGLSTLLNFLVIIALPLTILSPALTSLARAFDSQNSGIAYTAQNAPQDSPIVDGVIDAEYGSPIASDPADAPQGNLPMDLLDLYITDDANYFYFAYTVNVDIGATNWGKYLFYIDTTNDSNGATSDAWGRNVVVNDPHKPEFSINTWVDAQPYGTEDLQFWGWNQGTTSWSGPGTITAAALGTGSPSVIEWQVAKADLGNPSTIWVEVYSSGGGGGDNAQDTINEPADDWNATDWGTQAVLANSTQYPPPPLVVVDGVIDASYGDPLASDPADAPQGNLPMDLLDLYVTDDANNYYVAFTVNDNFAATNWGKYIFYIDTTNDANGATSDAWGRNVVVSDPHKPEFSVNTWVDAQPYGTEDLQFWSWNQGTTSWNGPGTISAAALGTGGPSVVEWQIAKSALGNPSTIWMEVYSTGGGGGDNAQDTINDPANDWNATNWSSQAVLLNSTEYPAPPPPPTGVCTSGAAQDNNIWWGDLGHNSRDGLYRAPGGPVTTNTEVTFRFRAACGDLTDAQIRVYNDRLNVQTISNLSLVQQEGNYEYWEVTLPASLSPTVYWYRFIAHDGTSTAYYEDDGSRNGSWGQTYGESQDNSWQLTFYDPSFQTPDWIKNAVVYQIFTDRFRDGTPSNITPAGSFFYNESTTIIRSNGTDWNTPICDPRDGVSDCPGVYSQNFYGGDLQGIIDELDYLETLGVTALYLNPIFESPSNHKYDTTDFSVIDDNFGDLALFQTLVTEASNRGMSIILDGVFNHTSSDSIYFDRYGRYTEVGACESETSPYRDWYYFTDVTPGTGECVGSDGTPDAATYTSWFGFDSLPKLNASLQAVRDLIWNGGETSIARFWVEEGADGWRLDVGGDVDPGTLNDPYNTYWEGFRDAVHQSNPDTYIVGEEWGNATSWVIDDQWDATMNYQFSSLMLSYWRDAPFVDNDHNAGSSAGILTPLSPSQLNEGLLNWIERYPPEALAAMMNLLGSHDTNRALFMLDHNAAVGTDDTLLDNPNYDWTDAMERLKGVILLQMTLPGAPTIYYGDEVGTVGQISYDGSTWQDDPYNRVPFPWLDEPGVLPFYTHLQSQTSQDTMYNYYALLADARNNHPALRTGSFDPLLVDDDNDLYAYGRKIADHSDVALVILNRAGTIASPVTQTVTLDLSGYLPYGTNFTETLTGDGYVVDANGLLTVTVPGQSGAVLVLNGTIAAPPAAVGQIFIDDESSEEVALDWNPAQFATSYDLYRSTLSGGGYEWIANTTDTQYIDTGLENAVTYYYVIVSRDDVTGLVSGYSPEAAGTPHHDLSTAWYNLQWPPTITHTISTITPTVNIYGQLWINGATGGSGPATGITAQVGYALTSTQYITDTNWIWVNMAYDSAQGNNDQFIGDLLPDYLGTYWYATRYSSDGGQTWYYADLGGPGFNTAQAGKMWVIPSGDLTAPNAPQNMTLDGTTTTSIDLSWDPNGEADLAGYEIYRQEISPTLKSPFGGFTRIAQLDASTTSFTDLNVVTDQTYEYYTLAYDTSFNRSSASNIITATAEARLAIVIMNVTVPVGTPGTVYIAGSIPGYPQWDPGAIPMTAGITNTWTITFTLLDGAQFEYKFARGNWDTVEKEADGNTEIPNRQLTVDYGETGVQVVNLTVANWRDPFVVATYPLDDAIGIDPSTTISITWNQSMTVNADFSVIGPDGVVSGTFGYDPGSFTTLFTPASPLANGATYAVSVLGEVDAIGDVQQVPTVFNFTTVGADLETTMTDSADPVLLGSVLTYTIVVNNYGPDTATNVILTDTLPAEMSFVSDDAGCSETTGVVTCVLPDLANGEFAIVQIAVSANQTGTFTNTATATSDLVDPNPVNDIAAEITTVTAESADLSITLSDSADPVDVGDTITYAITVTNNGPDSASGVMLVDTLPTGVGYISDDAGCNELSGTVTCALGDLASGQSVVIHITVSADQAGTWTNTAMVSSDAADPDTSDNTATEETTITEVVIPPVYEIHLPIVVK